jgi:predicted nucleic acid-binding protein
MNTMSGVVFDASTLILLARVGLLRRVVSSLDRALVGKHAAAEAQNKETDDALAIATLLEEGWIRRHEARGDLQRLARDFRLDLGEAEAVVLARETSLPCATDDGPAIRCCKVLGIPFVTAVGFLVGMVESGVLDEELGLELLTKLDRFGRNQARILDDAAARIRDTRRSGGQL